MDYRLVALIVIVVAIAAGLAVLWVIARNERTSELRRRFGAEYDRTAQMSGTRKAEILLMERERRVESFSIRQLTAGDRERFITEWRAIQSCFVDDPLSALEHADLFTGRLMYALGYPVTDFEQRAADLSVSHARVVDSYRAARQIALRHRQGHATTEDLRKAMISYRDLIDDLLETGSNGLHQKEVA